MAEILRGDDMEINTAVGMAAGANSKLADITNNGKYYKHDTVNTLIVNKSKYEANDIVEVLGYYTIDDGGSHQRIISTVSNSLSIDLENGLYANIYGKQDDLRTFGIKFDDKTAKSANTIILKKVLAYYNGFDQSEPLKNKTIYVIDFYYTITNDYFSFKNISLANEIVDSEKNYIIGIESSIAYINMKNFVISNSELYEDSENIYSMYAIKLADNTASWGGVKYNIENATITGFSVPMFIHTWNGSVKNINFVYTDTGCVLFGTSIDVSSVYVNRAKYGNVLGACYDIDTDTFSIASHSLLHYTSLQSLANDHITNNAIILGKTFGVQIGAFGMEAPTPTCESVFKPLISGCELIVLSANISSDTNDIPQYLIAADSDLTFRLSIQSMLNTSIINIKNQSSLNVDIENIDNYRKVNYVGSYKNKLIMNNNDINKLGVPKTMPFYGISKGYGGGENIPLVGSFYELETFITRNQKLKIPIHPLLWDVNPSARRAFKISVELTITDCDDQSSRTINNMYFISAFSSIYTKAVTTIAPTIKRLDAASTDYLIVSVDNSGDYPVLIIQMPSSSGTNPGSYYLSGKVSSGEQRENIAIENY